MIIRGRREQSLGRSAKGVQSETQPSGGQRTWESILKPEGHMSYSMLTPYHVYAPASDGWPSLNPYLLVLRPTKFFNINSNHLPSVR